MRQGHTVGVTATTLHPPINMASSYLPPFEGTGEVKEGFLCPLCLKDLQSFYQLQEHYEEEHSGDDRHVRGQLKSLVQKAKKAKDKLLKRDGEDKPEMDSYESFYYGGVDPYMWEPQELGATRSHLDFFKKHRAARIDHYVIEVNKLIIRLEKLTSFDRMNIDAGKIRVIEKSVVSWVSDSDVPFCPDCGNKFNLRNRRHHCRLCGSIMCKKCMEFVPLPLAYKLTSGTREALSVPGSPGQSQSPPTGGGGGSISGMGSRRGSISSLSSVTSILEEKDDERIRCCCHCMDTLMRKQQKLEEKDHVPDIVKLYERLRLCMDKVDERAPEYIRMAESLNAGETTYNLDTAGGLRMEVQKYYELIDALSKRILTLGMKEEPQPHPKNLQLQRMVRYTATLFVQEKLLGLMSLPTKDKYEEMKMKRKQEQEKRLAQERLAAQKRRQDSEKNRPASSTNGEPPQAPRVLRMTKAGGWLPSSDTLHTHGELEDPMLQQIENIRSFLRQAKAAHRHDEVAMLEENLRQLQDEYDQQQTHLAITLSQRLAQEELQHLEDRERGKMKHRAQSQAPGSTQATYTWQGSLNLTDTGSLHRDGEEENKEEELTPKAERSPPSMRAFPALTDQDEESPQWLGGDVEGQNSASFNPFKEEDSTTVEEDLSNPFSEEIQKEHKEVANGKKEYNPFEEEEEGGVQVQADGVTGNPFEEEEEENDEGNPFKEASGITLPGASTNPFEEEGEAAMPDVDLIEEELLLQQIDNIRAYIFDAKLNGRLDEVELLSENLRELQHTLQEQKLKTH
ncbi:rabenosyn-5 isoform X1 [Oncorhynchus mykiss]|uniref:Rabenosyn, RAB effector n=1 Tax=Oncorhynchus mykiss TaxID=8022 RepID=A0A8C7SNP7_ONCMY|nr:rabenosyn-5 isoform X1 [Oncorhynchus mykiss]XP_021422427.2 rabenosyn-5 isoform X1 [Oncorhynchus mykiss]XP_036803324.1 rabenosyn-5 isoform X1 [Oncorhynchus mykiss]XP_036803325.1 rabenosyn-5 isoform X1 [Oncorhynchus mykiss]